jgi:molecular chaperone DnaK
VILVGGQSRFPLVHQKVTEYFKKPPTKSVHPDEAVALGAALLAHSLGQMDGVVLIDVLPMAIGIGLPGGRFKTVIARNAPLPAAKRYTIATSRDGQTEIEMSIFQGESDKATENEYLGTLKLDGLPKGPRGTSRVEVQFEINNECLLKVSAKELSTGQEVSSTFSTRDTPEAVKQRLLQGLNGPVASSGQHPALPQQEAPGPVPASRPRPSAPHAPPVIPAGTPPPEVAAAATAAASSARPGGLLGWFRRLFGRA